MDDLRRSFRALHDRGSFVIANAWDVGSARLLAGAGAPALATTSSGFAATLGRLDQQVTAEELLDHAAALAAAVDVPVSVDSERCYDDVAGFVEELAGTGVAGFSIEDYDPATGAIDPVDVATGRVAKAADAGRPHGLVLMARAENHLYGQDDIDDTLARLRAYREAGADVVYAPGVKDPTTIELLVAGVDAPLNVLLWPGGPDVAGLAGLGVRRVSVGGALADVAYAAALDEYADIAAGGHGSRRRLERDERSRLA